MFFVQWWVLDLISESLSWERGRRAPAGQSIGSGTSCAIAA